MCRPYRAKTKGKVERFNGYLKDIFLVPLAATLKSSGRKLDIIAAKMHSRRWLREGETAARGEHQRQTRLKMATPPAVKTLEQFDFAFAIGAPRAPIQELAALAFIERI